MRYRIRDLAYLTPMLYFFIQCDFSLTLLQDWSFNTRFQSLIVEPEPAALLGELIENCDTNPSRYKIRT